ncbi:unnamed protein product, partial [Adineta ricciae]
FSSYNASADQCQNSRYLSVDIASGRCKCPARTFWNGTFCLNQGFTGDTCQANDWCRNDLNISCVSSTCLVIPATTTATSTTTLVATCTTLITFNDIPGQSSTSGIIPNGYKNLNWTNVNYINASTTPIGSGYRTALGNQTFLMYNANGFNFTISSANGTRFSFDSFIYNSAWYDVLTFGFWTSRAGQVTTTATYKAGRTYRSLVYCTFCTNVDTLIFNIKNGSMTTNQTQNGTQLILASLCISFGR